ncbi:MAG: 4-aminobutyrate--2-oxoglutarate transaminase [Acidobacteria bacterium]|nr:4-aminobutyrate--2-oxoglutarate transaminase [Acidobacteriota bacterium]
MPTNAELNKRRKAATPRGVGMTTEIFVDHAFNAELWDVEGKRYIDFAGGIAVLNVGHRNPAVISAAGRQMELFTHTCYQVVPYENYIQLAEKLNQLVPGDFEKKSVLFSTGAEAVENAVKIARAATGRSGVISFSGAFHGRTMLGLALTGKVVPYKIGFGPYPPEIFHAPFPSLGVTSEESISALRHIFKSEIDPKRVAAIIFEPVQGEGGYYVAPRDFVAGLRKICDEHEILLIDDEIQSGFGRTGRWFAIEHYGVTPDIVISAKSLAGGFPLSAVTGNAGIMDAPAPGGLGGTYAGNPVAIAAALASIELIEKENLLERSQLLAMRLLDVLNSLKAEVAGIDDIRSLGAMIAVEFNDEQTSEPDPDFAKRVQSEALSRGLILLTCGVYGNVIRFPFPLTIEDEIFEEAIGILKRTVKDCQQPGIQPGNRAAD